MHIKMLSTRTPEPADVDGRPFSADLHDALLVALVGAASKGNRRQADLGVALHRMDRTLTAEQALDALQNLRADGYVENWLPLYDGGMLVWMTNRGMDEAKLIESRRLPFATSIR